MLIFFSVCSVIYALFYMVIIVSNKKINYVENVFSLNFDKIEETESDFDQEEFEEVKEGYTIESVQ